MEQLVNTVRSLIRKRGVASHVLAAGTCERVLEELRTALANLPKSPDRLAPRKPIGNQTANTLNEDDSVPSISADAVHGRCVFGASSPACLKALEGKVDALTLRIAALEIERPRFETELVVRAHGAAEQCVIGSDECPEVVVEPTVLDPALFKPTAHVGDERGIRIYCE